MKYWKLETKYILSGSNIGLKFIDSFKLVELEVKDELLSEEVYRYDNGAEQSFSNEREAYSLIWDYLNKPAYARLPFTDDGKKMLYAFIPIIEDKFPEVMV